MNLTKLIQIVHHFLVRNGFRLNYTKLIKLLYLADREALSRWDSAISTDRYASLPQGPVLSGLYDLVKGAYLDKLEQVQWNSFFMKDEYELIALHKEELPINELSPRELQVLDEIESLYHDWDFGKLIDLLHDQTLFPEWKDPGESAFPLSSKEILQAIGRSEEEITQITEEEQSYREEEEYLKRCCV